MNVDTHAMAVLAAERELQTVVVLLSVIPLSDIATERLEYAITAIRAGLAVQRARAGLQPQRAAA